MSGLPLVGDEFAGFRVRSVLGRGGMSVVYQAENLRLSSVIALKVLAPELAADDQKARPDPPRHCLVPGGPGRPGSRRRAPQGVGAPGRKAGEPADRAG